MKKGLKVNTVAWLAAAVLLIAAVPINLIFSKVDTSIDMTPYSAFTLSDKAKESLSSLKEPVTLNVLCDMEELYSYYGRGTEDYMKVDMYAKTVKAMAQYDKVTLKEIDIIKNPDFVKETDPDGKLGLQSYDILVECGGKYRNVSNTELFANNADTGNIEFYGENFIVKAIDYLQSGVTPTMYFLTGHGEKSVSDYSYLVNILGSQNYLVKELDLTSENIPEDALMIICAGPKQDITDQEYEKISKYLAAGGNISLFMSPNAAEFKYTNIEKILSSYEIGMDYNRIRETERDYFAGNDDPYTIMCSYTEVDFTEALRSDQETAGLALYMPASRSFYSISDEDNETGITVEPLIQTFQSAQSEAYGGIDKKGGAISGSLIISARAEDPNRKNSKLFTTGTAEFMADKTMQEGYTILSPYVFLCCVTWMDQLNSDMIYPTRVAAVDYITIPDVKTGNIILAVIIIYPVLISSAGVIIWMRRRNS